MNRSILSVVSFCVSLAGCLTLWNRQFNLPPVCRQFPNSQFSTPVNLLWGLIVLAIGFGLTIYLNELRDRQINEEKLRTSEARLKEAQRVARGRCDSQC